MRLITTVAVLTVSTTGSAGSAFPTGFAEPVAVKQGWMCWMDGWMHFSTGVISA
jgi:hypothetical protein